MTDKCDEAELDRQSGEVRRDGASALVRRAVARIDRRSGPGMRRGGRGAGGSPSEFGSLDCVVDGSAHGVYDGSGNRVVP